MRTTMVRMALIAFCAMPALVHAEWLFGASAQARYNDNVGNAGRPVDIVSDEIVAAKISLSQFLVLDRAYALTVGAELGGDWYRHFHGLNDASLDVSLALRRKWGLGPFAPWARFALAAGRTAVNDSYRNLSTYRASLAGGERLSNRVNLWGEYSYEHRDGTTHGEQFGYIPNDAFTQNGQTLTVDAECVLVERLTLNVGLLARRGDVLATTRPYGAIYYASRALAEDEAFGENWYAYRLLGNTYGGHVALHYALGEHHLIGIDFLHLDTYAQGNRYLNSIPEITWDYRF